MSKQGPKGQLHKSLHILDGNAIKDNKFYSEIFVLMQYINLKIVLHLTLIIMIYLSYLKFQYDFFLYAINIIAEDPYYCM